MRKTWMAEKAKERAKVKVRMRTKVISLTITESEQSPFKNMMRKKMKRMIMAKMALSRTISIGTNQVRLMRILKTSRKLIRREKARKMKKTMEKKKRKMEAKEKEKERMKMT